MRAALVASLLALSSATCSASEPSAPGAAQSNAGPKSDTDHPQAGTGTSIATIQQPKTHKSANYSHSESAEWGNVGEWALVFLTAALAIVTWQLVIKTQDLVTDGKVTAKKQLRAYLGVHSADVGFTRGLSELHELLQAIIQIKNAGQTPAHNVVQCIKAEIRPLDNSSRVFVSPTTDRGPIVMAPGTRLEIRYEFAASHAKLVEMQSKNTLAIYVWGAVTYQDIFGDKQTLSFQYRNLASKHERDIAGESLTGWELGPDGPGVTST